MGLHDALLQQMSKRERIQITSGKHEILSFSLLISYVVGSLSIVAFILLRQGFSWELLLLAFALTALFFPLYSTCRKMADISVKGDVLLINQLFRPCKVTSIKSVRQIKTRKFLHVSVTSLTYFLDGHKGKIILFKRLKTEGNEPETIIKLIRQVA